MTTLLRIRGLTKSYTLAGRRSVILHDIDLDVRSGECLGLVGESGSGKTTLALCGARLVEADGGSVVFDGEDLYSLPQEALRRRRQGLQMVLQNSLEAFDPRLPVGESVAEPLRIHGMVSAVDMAPRVAELLAEVGLAADLHTRYPHQLSGGQRQRLGIARALATGPRLLILDEPVSSLDVSVRAQILALLSGLQRRHRLTLLFISHDLATVAQMADRLAVMYRGRIVELGSRQQICRQPAHPYTEALFAAAPSTDPRRRRPARYVIDGDVGSDPDSGCPYFGRCHLAATLGDDAEGCRTRRPELRSVVGDDGGMVARQLACHHPGALERLGIASSNTRDG